jgi:CDP-diacylglycerol--glycerol-3-phosphate 3-phosphatidyltransferase
MVAAALVLLSARPPLALAAWPAWLIPAPAVAIVGREITMSGAHPSRALAAAPPHSWRGGPAFREWAAAAGGKAHGAVAVNALGKWKTAAQMTAITALLGAGETPRLAVAGAGLLWASAGLALASLAVYMAGALPLLLD